MKLFLKSTLAIIVLYKEKLEDTNTFLSLDKAIPTSHVLNLLIYDNSPNPQKIKEHLYNNFNIKYIHDPLNPGVSTAYNYAAEIAKKLNKEWLLILDQDTNFNKNIFYEFYDAINLNKDVFLFAPILKIDKNILLSPCKFNFYGKHLKYIDCGIQYFKNNSPVNSGMLIQVDAFQRVGGYNEKVPLDLSDHQFIARFKTHYKKYLVINSIGFQNFSVLEDNKEKQLVRFKYYCKGVYNFEAVSVLRKGIMILFLILKAIKKSIKYSTFRFFSILFREAKMFLNDLIFIKN